MVIHHIHWYGNKIQHDCKTVREFIDKELMKIENKEKKYFRIRTKQAYNRCNNLLMYFQNGELKSHHSTCIRFDYKDVLDYEICDGYSMNDITVDNIISIDCDYREEIEKQFEEENFTFDIETLGMSKEEEKKYHRVKIFEEVEIINKIKNNEDLDSNSLKRALQILIKPYEEIVKTKRELQELKKEVYEKDQKIKWLGSIMK